MYIIVATIYKKKKYVISDYPTFCWSDHREDATPLTVERVDDIVTQLSSVAPQFNGWTIDFERIDEYDVVQIIQQARAI